MIKNFIQKYENHMFRKKNGDSQTAKVRVGSRGKDGTFEAVSERYLLIIRIL
jgi:hypothetical protein